MPAASVENDPSADMAPAAGCRSRKPPDVLRKQFGKHSVWFSRRRHPDPALAGALNCPLHEPRRLGLFNKLADVGEPSRLVLRNRHRYEVRPVAVLQHLSL